MRLADLVLIFTQIAPVVFAQSAVTPATGDTRSITKPGIPVFCAQVSATKWLQPTHLVNQDPWNVDCEPYGIMTATTSCATQGGISFEPSSSPTSYVSAENSDGAAIAAAMSSCPAGQWVEVILGSSGQNSIVLPQTVIKNSSGQGIGLWADAGTEVDASRSPSDYGGGSCGTISTSGTTSCGKWLIFSGGSGGGIGGYGIFNGRGWDKFSTGGYTNQSFYLQRLLTYCVAHGGTINGSPACPSGLPAYQKSYGPNGLEVDSTTGFTAYQLTMRNSGNFLANVRQDNNCLFWGVKLLAPFEMSNTDGWDPESTTNCTFTNGFISNGDNHTALKSTESNTQNITFSNSQTGAGICIAIGTDVSHNVSNYLVTNIVQRGNLNNQQSCGMEITDGSFTGTVSQVTYQNICSQNENQVMNWNVNSSTVTGLLTRNITALAPTSTTSWNSGSFAWQGASSGNKLTAEIDNVQVAGTNNGGSSSNASLYLGPGTVQSSIITNLSCGSNGVICANNVTTSPAPYCTTSSWQQLTGELNLYTSAVHNNQTLSSAGGFWIQAVVQPTTEISTKEQPYPSASVQIFDNCTAGPAGCTPIATVPLTGDGFYASYNVPSVLAGTHNYFAYYPGDSFYSPYQFGSVTVTNGAPSTPVTLTTTGNVMITGTLQ